MLHYRLTRVDLGWTICGRFFSPDGQRFPYAEEQLLHGLFADSPKANVPCPPSAKCTHSAEDDGGDPRVSSDHDEFLLRFRRHGAEGIFPPVLENEDNRFP